MFQFCLLYHLKNGKQGNWAVLGKIYRVVTIWRRERVAYRVAALTENFQESGIGKFKIFG